MKYDVSYVHADEQTKEMAPISFGSVHGLFGNASHGMDTSNTAESTNQPASALINYKPFSFFRDVLTLDSLVLLDQVHGIAGQVLTNHNALPTAFTIQGDYLITALPSIGLAVRTADCLPVICTDGTRAVGIAHAGWRGSVAGVQVNMVDRMCELYGVSLQELKVIFGPALGACCYRVDTDFVAHLPGILGDDAGAQVLFMRERELFFDLVEYNRAALVAYGIPDGNIDVSRAVCTMCDMRYHSHRRDGEQAGRQLSVVALAASNRLSP